MENVPPPRDLGWPARGVKRSHTQMRDTTATASQRTRSRSPSTTLHHITADTSSSASSPGSAEAERDTPQASALRVQAEAFEAGRPTLLGPRGLGLPSFRELDERTRQMLERDREIDALYEQRQQRLRELRELRREQERIRDPEEQQSNIEQRIAAFRARRRAMERARGMPTAVIDLTGDGEEEGREGVAMELSPEELRASARDAFAERARGWRPPDNRPALFGGAGRGPRFPAEIIDLSADTPRAPRVPPREPLDLTMDETSERNNGPASSPEVLFLRERPRRPPAVPEGAAPPGAPNFLLPGGRVAPIDLVDDDDDDMQILREHLVPDAQRHNNNNRDTADPGFAGLMHNFQRISRLFSGGHRPAAAVRPQNRAGRIRDPVGGFIEFIAPGRMDFNAVAFDLGYGPREEEEQREREPSVVPVLEPAPEGFTRAPEENDVLVCPGCDCELSAEGDEVKRQVWLVKGCGHVYCGVCAASRTVTKKRKGKEPESQKRSPLKKCEVKDCGARTTGKQMVQLFL